MDRKLMAMFVGGALTVGGVVGTAILSQREAGPTLTPGGDDDSPIGTNGTTDPQPPLAGNGSGDTAARPDRHAPDPSPTTRWRASTRATS
jgi:hypothetical protein